jgi:hypothetical protein
MKGKAFHRISELLGLASAFFVWPFWLEVLLFFAADRLDISHSRRQWEKNLPTFGQGALAMAGCKRTIYRCNRSRFKANIETTHRNL